MSNELVAASCAAILAVYAAGYWRTRDEARRFETQSQARRPARPAPTVPAAPAVPSAAAAPPVATEIPDAPAVPAKTAATAAPRPGAKVVAVANAVPATSAVVTAPTEPPSATQPEIAASTPDPAVAANPEPAAPPGVVWHDGVYTGWGQSFHGDIEARVVIRDGRIRTSEIATCATRYPCYVIETIFNQPVDRQSPDVDRVSRATESADAYSDAVWQALQKAEAGPGTATGPAVASP